MTKRHSLVFEAPYQLSVVEETIPPLAPGQVLIGTQLSAISPGTEMLVYRGQLPSAMALDATIASLAEASTQYPLRYGYACVGRILAVDSSIDPTWIGRPVFAFHPHSSHIICTLAALLSIPDDLSSEVAALYPNMETAITFLLDGAPIIGERVTVVGAGIVGLLTTALLARFPLAKLTVIDPLAARRQMALALGAHQVFSPDEWLHSPSRSSSDLTYELSGNPAALDTAIQCTGFAGRVVIGSWYGEKRAAIDLGGYFHRSRIRLIASQVSTLPPDKAARWDRERRTALTWEMLRQIDVSTLISHRFPIQQAAAAYQQIDQRSSETGQVLLYY